MTSNRSTPWFTSQRPNARARLRLFCFPYAGGGAQIYRLWPQSLPSEVECCVAQLPGRGTRLREQPFTNLDALVEAATEAITPLLDMPFALFGHSMGAMISFELARRLRELPQTRDSLYVALTGYGQPSDRLSARQAGFDHHLTKPADPDEVLSLIAAWRAQRGAARDRESPAAVLPLDKR